MANYSKMLLEAMGNFDAYKDGEVLSSCKICSEPTRVVKTINSAIGTFKAPCAVECFCDRTVKKKADTDTILFKAGIPQRFIHAKSNFIPESFSAYLFGDVRTGKTTAACSVARLAVESGKSVRFIVMSDVRNHEFADKDKGMSFKADLKLPDVLIIDDLGKSETSEWAVSLLFEVINDRYNSMKDVLITSNYSLGSLTRVLSEKGAPKTAEAITRRIQDTCKPYRFGQWVVNGH